MAKACPSCGFLNDAELGACLLCRRDLASPGVGRAFGAAFPKAEVPPEAHAALGPGLEVEASAPVGAGYATGAAAPMLATEPMFDLESAPAQGDAPLAVGALALGAAPPIHAYFAAEDRLASAPAARPPAHAPSSPPRLALDAPARPPAPPRPSSPAPSPAPAARASSRPPPHATFDPARDASMAAAALAASGFSVDFTPATLSAVDAYLARAAPRPLDPEAPEGRFLLTELGAYLGEVVARAQGGVWSLEAKAPEAVCVSLRDGSQFSPFVWLRRRLEDPSVEPLASKYARVFLGRTTPPPPREEARPAGRTVPFERAAGAADEPQAHLREARALLGAGRVEEATERLEALARERPRDVDALGLLARVHDDAARFEEAQQGYDRALALDATRADLWLGKGLSLDRHGFADKAIIALHRATQLEPSLVDGWRRMGAGYLRFRRADDALACFDEVLDREPDDAFAHRGRAEALRALGREDEALAALVSSAERGDAEAWFVKGALEQARGEDDEAVRSLARYLAADPRGRHASEAAERLGGIRARAAPPGTRR